MFEDRILSVGLPERIAVQRRVVPNSGHLEPILPPPTRLPPLDYFASVPATTQTIEAKHS